MAELRNLIFGQISSHRFDGKFGQLFCFGAAPVVLLFAWLALAKYALTPGEMLIGILSSLSTALLLVVLGFVLPLAQQLNSSKSDSLTAHPR